MITLGLGAVRSRSAWIAAASRASRSARSPFRIQDSISSGLTIVAPGSRKGEGTLTQARLEKVNITRTGLGGASHHGLWIRDDAVGCLDLVNCEVADIRNESVHFSLLGESGGPVPGQDASGP